MPEFHASYEYEFDPKATNNTAASIYRYALEGGQRILDLGSGPAIVSSYLKSTHGRHVTAVDSDAGRLEVAKTRGVDRTIVGDLGDAAWADRLAGESFDVIILADVLEHLVEPGAVLELIHKRGLLAEGGFLVISIPNASHEGVVAELWGGGFRYRETGLLDSTHIRFFTKETITELLERHGWFVRGLDRTTRTLEQTELSVSGEGIPPEVRAELRQVPESQTYQFILRAEPLDAAREMAQLRERIEAERNERHMEQKDTQRLRNEVQTLSQLLEAQKAGAAQAEELLRQQVVRAREEARTYHRRLTRIYNTRAWKIGWLLYGVVRAFRRPKAAWKRLRKGNLKPILTAETPAEKAARMPQVVVDYELTEADTVRSEYLRALSKTDFETDKRHLAMAVFTSDLSEGRGDLYVAAGLGRYLERLGYEVVYLPRDKWYDVPNGTQIYLALLDDVDLMQVPADLTRIAWIRNRTDDWRNAPSLPLYDAVLCSSERSLAEIDKHYPGPTGILRIGVDAELFEPAPEGAERTGAVTTVNLWGRERQLFKALRRCRLDFPLGIYGQERGLNEDLMPCWKGPASFFALPSLYRQATLVLDDHNHTTQPYGNVNSRVYESLASGSLVVTNAALGLKEIGLDDIPSYTTPAELDGLIHRFLAHPRDATTLARKLQQIVLRDHTFERRALQFDAFLRDLDISAKASDRIVLAFYPSSPGNPYEKMLYASAAKARITAMPVDDLSTLLDSRLGNLGERLVLHVHWTAPVLGPGMTPGEARDLGKKFLRQIEELQKRGAKLVWTVHNVMPHECRFPDEEAAFRQQLADRADLLHVMCERTSEYVSAYYTLPPEKIRVVPHPNYIDVYPNILDQARARAELGLKPDQTVFCFLGGIRPYKGVDRLLDAFGNVAEAKPESRLIVVGPPGRFPEIEAMAERCEADPRIIANFNRVADPDVQLYMNAADVVVLPHRSVLNSGSVMLALSFGRPVIAPAVGCVAELLTPDVSMTFEAEDPAALTAAMMKADELKDQRYRDAAFEKASAYPIPAISEEFSGVIRTLVDGAAGRT